MTRTDDRQQRTEDREQKTEDRRKMTEERWQMTEERGQRTEDRGQNTEDGILHCQSVFCSLFSVLGNMAWKPAVYLNLQNFVI
jgi:hypothetical protein